MKQLFVLLFVTCGHLFAEIPKMEKISDEPKGVIGRSYKDGMPVIWRFVNEPPSADKMAALPWLVVISWEYDGAKNNGMPSEEDNRRILALENTIEQHIEKADFCEHSISKTGANLKELIYYASDRDFFMTKFNETLRGQDRYPIRVTFYEDREWKEHENARSLFEGGEKKLWR